MTNWLQERGWDTTGFTLIEALLIVSFITLRIIDVGLVQPLAWDLFIKELTP